MYQFFQSGKRDKGFPDIINKHNIHFYKTKNPIEKTKKVFSY